MTSQDDSERPRPDFSPGSNGPAAGDDVVEQGGRPPPVLRWRPPLIAVILAAGLLAGLVVGYAAGDRHASHRAAPSSGSRVSPPAVALSPAVTESVSQCSAQIDHTLQLGVQVTNQSAASVTLLRVTAVLPLGGLKATSQAWGPCGELPVADGVPGTSGPGSTLPAGASAWFTVTFRVLVKCPAALPVQFAVDYDRSGGPATVRLPGFADLGHVPYTGCLA